jgi:TolA-binding protein
MKGNPLARHVRAPDRADDAERQWTAIGALRASRARRRRLTIAVPVLAAALLTFVLLRSHRAPDGGPELLVSASDHVEMNVLPGIAVLLDPRSTASVRGNEDERVEIELVSGAATFDVKHRPARTVIVSADAVDIAVVGTRFRVALDAGEREVVVVVERGAVEVRRRGTTALLARLEEGRTGRFPSGDVSSARQEPAEPATAAAREGGPDSPMAPSAPSPSVASAPATRPAGSDAARARPASSGASAAAVASVPPDEAKALFNRANSARQEGRPRDAAALYDELRRRFPEDPRAGLAAFELGRLRMDALGDVAGAAEALGAAVALGHEASFHEDAQARLVRALGAMGDRHRCREARRTYLERYPMGLHAKAVADACGPP